MDTYTSGITYIFDHATEQWSSGPSMLDGRYRFGCGKFKSAAHEGREIIVVAGGYAGSDGYPFGKVEFLDFSRDNTWTLGKSFFLKQNKRCCSLKVLMGQCR